MRTLGQIGEVASIERARQRLGRPSRRVVVGIGDDAAAVRLGGGSGRLALFASDMLVEGVHFTARTPGDRIGWKALAVNVSDVAAMGGRPECAVVSLGAPARTPIARLDGVSRGLARCARAFGVDIVGGDTTRAPQLVIDVAILGTIQAGRIARRSTARVGERVFVTGRLGGSLPSGRHARFIPRVAHAQRLVARGVRTMIDLSDGLASDLWQLARASDVRFRIDAASIPISAAATRAGRRARGWRGSPLWHALMDGEDFELLFTAAPSVRLPSRLLGVPVTPIGRVAARGAAVELAHPDGRVAPLRPEGFQHFRLGDSI